MLSELRFTILTGSWERGYSVGSLSWNFRAITRFFDLSVLLPERERLVCGGERLALLIGAGQLVDFVLLHGWPEVLERNAV